MKVWVLSRLEFEDLVRNKINDQNVHLFNEHCFISILDSIGVYGKRILEQDHPNFLTLVFDDVEVDGKPSPTVSNNTKAINNEQAQQIFDFIRFNKDKKICIIHCAAGISRSGAIGTFINDLYGDENFLEFKHRNPKVFPNQRILRMLNKLLREQIKK